MVRRQDQQDGLFAFVAPGERLERRRRHGGCGAPRDRLQDDCRRRDADRPELLRHHEAVCVVAHHDGRPQAADGRKALGGGLQQRALAEQGDELLGMLSPRERPESAAGATRQDDGDDGRIEAGRHSPPSIHDRNATMRPRKAASVAGRRVSSARMRSPSSPEP